MLPNGVDGGGDGAFGALAAGKWSEQYDMGRGQGTGGIGQVISLDIVATGHSTATFQPELWFSLHIVVVSTRGIKYMTNAKLLSLRTNTCNKCK